MGKGHQDIRAHGVTNREAPYKRRPERRQEVLLDTDKLLIACTLYTCIALGCLDG